MSEVQAKPITPKKQVNKFDQFNKELAELCGRYQYKLHASLRFTTEKIDAFIEVLDVAPAPKEKKK